MTLAIAALQSGGSLNMKYVKQGGHVATGGAGGIVPPENPVEP